MRGAARGRGGGGRGQPSFRGAMPVVAAPTTPHQAVPGPAQQQKKKKAAKKKPTQAVVPPSNAFDQIAPQKTLYVLNDDLYSSPPLSFFSLSTRSNSRVMCHVSCVSCAVCRVCRVCRAAIRSGLIVSRAPLPAFMVCRWRRAHAWFCHWHSLSKRPHTHDTHATRTTAHA
jgi:hypothetical protein